ncbi:SH3 domain-containing protein 19-like isoform X2 [Periophthalmus magnuspinnatus]|uniref:SH3 domain-containing protein 19-like isoform X2 n=1 Tax=Periophthalmus magnuspinnatus TaxID=409849 RepID=UPI00145ADAB3|nr:SH3 domain-containing protein 19-like isoform X2 [Periophthalmus magnuspinnatus]
MAEARSEEDEENMRESREQVSRRAASSGGRPDRRKPEHRHSQGPLSSIRAAIKRTSNRSTSLLETPPRDRDRERERERDRRRPEITVLSAEPISSWFPGAGIPPPPPPAAQIWGSSLSSSLDVQPPPSYEEVIREKNQEQVIVPAAAARPPPLSSSPQQSVCTTTIATQTDAGPAPDAQTDTQVRRPLRPPRPSAPNSTSKPPKNANTVDRLFDLLPNGDSTPSISTQTPPFTSSAAETDHSEAVRQRPRPRPRSKINLQPVRDEVKVQTLVKLREDGLKTLAARRANEQTSDQEVLGGTYLQELLDAFSSDDWGFPEQRSASQSESEDESNQEVTERDEEDDMATLRARIQAFEQMHDGNFEETRTDPCALPKPRPEPKPRPRLPQNKPTVSPKPKNITSSGDVLNSGDCKGFWEDGGESVDKSEQSETSEKPLLAPKPESNADNAAPVPLPRPSPPLSQPRLPPRPSIAPRSKPGGAPQERGSTAGPTTPPLPPRPAVDIRVRAKMEAANGDETAAKTVKGGNPRPDVPTKPTSVTCRRSSAPNLVSNFTPCPDSGPVPSRPSGPPRPALRKSTSVQSSAEPPLPPRPTGVKLLPLRPPPIKSFPGRPPPPSVNTNSNPPPSLTKSPSSPSLLSDALVSTNQTQGVATSTNQTQGVAPSTNQTQGVAPSTNQTQGVATSTNQTQGVATSTNQTQGVATSTNQTQGVTTSTNQTQGQRASKKRPPLPPRPKPGHPLYNSDTKQEVLIVMDDPSPAPSEPNSQSGDSSGPVSAPVTDSVCLLDLDLEPDQNQDPNQGPNQTKAALEGLSQTQNILSLDSTEQKKEPEPTTISGPRCVASFDYSAVEEDELTFSRGDVIALLDVIGGDPDWGRGQLHGRIGIFPLNFTQTVEPLPTAPPPGQTDKTPPEKTGPASHGSTSEEWAVAVFDFPGQTAEDLCFQKGAMIRVLERVDAEWRRGRVEDREGLYPAAFTQPATKAQPITAQHSDAKATALFDFTAENDDELTLKVGDILTQVEPVDEQWIMGVVGDKRGIVPKNYISQLT